MTIRILNPYNLPETDYPTKYVGRDKDGSIMLLVLNEEQPKRVRLLKKEDEDGSLSAE